LRQPHRLGRTSVARPDKAEGGFEGLCTATAVGGCDGSVKSSDGVLDLDLAYPKELGGPGGAPDGGSWRKANELSAVKFGY